MTDMAEEPLKRWRGWWGRPSPAGQALRGSSGLHGWGDSNLYLRREGASLRLTVEHRAGPGRDGLVLELRACGDALALHLVDADGSADDRDPARAASRLDHVEQVLARLSAPIPRGELRRACHMARQRAQ